MVFSSERTGNSKQEVTLKNFNLTVESHPVAIYVTEKINDLDKGRLKLDHVRRYEESSGKGSMNFARFQNTPCVTSGYLSIPETPDIAKLPQVRMLTSFLIILFQCSR